MLKIHWTMYRIISLVFFTSIYFLSSVLGQSQKRDLVEWNETFKISLEDYKGRITDTLNYVNTNCGIYCIPQIIGDSASITIIAYMDKNKSWIRKKYADSLALTHEQGHFDLTEIYARKFKKRVMSLRLNKRNFTKNIKLIYDTTWEDLQKQHTAYDKATQGGSVEFAQRTWQNYIRENLTLYTPYSTQTIKFPIPD